MSERQPPTEEIGLGARIESTFRRVQEERVSSGGSYSHSTRFITDKELSDALEDMFEAGRRLGGEEAKRSEDGDRTPAIEQNKALAKSINETQEAVERANMSDSDRITRLETHFEYMRTDLTDLKAGQKDLTDKMNTVISTLNALPTKNDLWSWKVQWIAIGIGAVALIVGGIIGGLDWIKLH